MAHIPDGVLSIPVLVAGTAVALGGTVAGLRALKHEHIPHVALMSAVFFVAALVHFPVPPSSVHLILNGLVGILLGWTAFPAIVVALLLQAVLFGFGGLATLGVNVANMAVPALLCHYLFRLALKSGNRRMVLIAAGLAGALGVAVTALMVASALAASGREFLPAARLVVVTHIPVMVIEAAFSAAVVALLLKVKPEFIAPLEAGNG